MQFIEKHLLEKKHLRNLLKQRSTEFLIGVTRKPKKAELLKGDTINLIKARPMLIADGKRSKASTIFIERL